MQESQFLSAFVLKFRSSETSQSKEEREPERSPLDVVHQIEQILPELEDGDLKKLLNPCVVLVLSGYKPQTHLYSGPLETSTEIFGKNNIDVLYQSPVSLIAARNRLRESKLLQMILSNVKIELPMNAEQFDRLEEVIAAELKQMLGAHKDIAQTIYEGIVLGYPDQAIMDAALAKYKDNQKEDSFKHRNRLIPAGIVEGNEKLEYLLEYFPSPDFDVAPEHANDPSVVSASTRQREFLEKFYSLPEVITMLESVGIQKTEYQDVEIIKG